MANPVNRAFAASRKAHKTLAGVSVTVTRGLQTSDPVTATLGFGGDELFEPDDLTKVYTRHQVFLIDVDEYLVGGTAVEPQRHDSINAVIGGVSLNFEVLDGSADSPARFEGRDRVFWRIYTRELS